MYGVWGVCVSQQPHLFSAGGYGVPSKQPWLAVCLLGGVSKVSTLTPINFHRPLPTPALPYQGKATHGRSFTSPVGVGNWEEAGPEEDDTLVAMATSSTTNSQS